MQSDVYFSVYNKKERKKKEENCVLLCISRNEVNIVIAKYIVYIYIEGEKERERETKSYIYPTTSRHKSKLNLTR